ncbi:MAG TPA: 50S ribosome-binding GTPase, partial [Planctomycetota bacterium]|nr:50S ribosome-binding GTPase [Planctomycetota bacterium]
MGSDWQTKLLTPPGPAGVAVLEVAGPDVWRALARIGLAERPVGALALAALQLPNGPGDEALLWVRAEERVELHVHGSGPLLDELSLALAGTRIDPVGLEDRAFQALAAAPSRTGARLILAQAEGALRQRLESLASADSRSARAGLETLLAHSRACTPWFSPQRLVLQGPVNAGKSTLFNALVGYERVITSDEAGTTRDAIIERIQLGTVPIDLIDTAGLRAVTAESLEGRGQALGQWLAQ